MSTGIVKILTVVIALTLAIDVTTAAATAAAPSPTPTSMPKESTVATSLPAASAATTEPKIGAEIPKAMSDVISKSIVDQIMTSLNKNASDNVTKSQNVLPPEVYAGAMMADQPQGDITKTLQRRSQMAEGKHPLVSRGLHRSMMYLFSKPTFHGN